MVDGWPMWALATKGLEALVTNRFLMSDLPQTALARQEALLLSLFTVRNITAYTYPSATIKN